MAYTAMGGLVGDTVIGGHNHSSFARMIFNPPYIYFTS